MNDRQEKIKLQILNALEHPEADEGLYLRNFAYVHDEDERPGVEGKQEEILDALNASVMEGKVTIDQSFDEVVFHLAKGAKTSAQPEGS